jgi:hypothetical protein
LVSWFSAEFEAAQREAEARALGGEMYRQAEILGSDTVECVAALLDAVAQRSRGALAAELANSYGRAMVADAAARHYQQRSLNLKPSESASRRKGGNRS